MRATSALLLIPTLALAACATSGTTPVKRPPREGPWRMVMDLRSDTDSRAVLLPFLFDLQVDSDSTYMRIFNGDEVILVKDVIATADSFFARAPVFEPYFSGKPLSDSVITGFWYNPLKGPAYRIPFVASAGKAPRFQGASTPFDPSGEWACRFAPDTPDEYSALGIFEQHDGIVTGTFATETGDYRFLEGVAMGDSLLLSAFDGSHAYLFNAALHGDSLVGLFRSGIHSCEPWAAVRHTGFRLRDPDSLTTLKADHDLRVLTFPDLAGEPVSPMSPRYDGRVRILQLMGSWCSNCMDETALFTELHERYHEQGLDVFAIAFEKHPEPERALAALRRYKERMGVEYPVLYGGGTEKANIAEKLPFLERLMSWPTSIFIDRSGRVRRVHTGFYGPGTGVLYDPYKRGLEEFVKGLLAEPVAPSSASGRY